jgi:hypothetical protein
MFFKFEFNMMKKMGSGSQHLTTTLQLPFSLDLLLNVTLEHCQRGSFTSRTPLLACTKVWKVQYNLT